MSRPRYRTLAHGADVRVAVWGGDEEELLSNAVLAAATLALARVPPSGERRRRAIPRWPPDVASRLVRAVNEALFALYARREAATGVALTPRGAALLVTPLPAGVIPVVEVKAATYHDLRPRRRGDRLVALLTLDL